MILNVYKPKNWTSFDVVAKMRGILKTKKIGHAGTLDPLAEGVLVVLTEKDTKKQNEFMKLEKEYMADIAFGVETDSYDLETPLNVIKKDLKIENLAEVLVELLPKYIGKVKQKVPAYSAVKVGGRPLYKKARKGGVSADVLPEKEVMIYGIDVLGYEYRELPITGADKNEKVTVPVAKMRVRCSSGTYIRSLAHDLGIDTGFGGTLAGLLRSRIGDFKVEDAKKLSEL